MNLDKLKSLFASHGCKRIHAKHLAANDNSKNQVYLGGSFDVLNIFPFTEITADDSGDWKKTRFKAQLNFSWLSESGKLHSAPKSQLILYPKYPEVRFSGFLAGCDEAPSHLMANRIEGRILFLGVAKSGQIIGHVVAPDSQICNEVNSNKWEETHGVFLIIPLNTDATAIQSRKTLLSELLRIHELGWIESKRLSKDGDVMDCNSPNCGGYTLEAELGITPNGYSEPDFMGWEVKQFGVSNFERLGSSTITLMTPEPTHGIYKEEGVETFIHRFGYPDKKGKPDRLNFGGVHKFGERQRLTGLTLQLPGFDVDSGKIRDSSGSISLVSDNGVVAASWSFASLLKHWRRKHALACYVPSQNQREPNRKYRYGEKVILGTGTRFDLYLQEMSKGNIYYDPGIKMENVSSAKPNIKRRSQFRISSKNLPCLYEQNELFDLYSQNRL